MIKKKIGIVGYGYVGRAMFKFFERHYDVIFHDPHVDGSSSVEEINLCDLAVVCVPTPTFIDGECAGHCDTSIVEHSLAWIETPLILLKSTVPVGFTDRMRVALDKRIVFSPEYCGESSYWTPYKFHADIKETPFFIFGGHHRDTSAMVDYFLPVTGPVKTYRQTTARAAELAKYMENSFYATKIAFCYEFAEIANTLLVDFNEVRELWLLDPRINPMHTAVFHQNQRPFSGKCLPKDLAAICERSEENGYDPKLLREVQNTNERIAGIRAVRGIK